MADRTYFYQFSRGKYINVIGITADLVASLRTGNNHGSFIFLDHLFDVAVHGVAYSPLHLDAVINGGFVIGGVDPGQGVIDILGVVAVENLLLSVRIDKRTQEGKNKHDDQGDRPENSQSVADKTLEYLTAGRQDLYTGNIVQPDLGIALLLCARRSFFEGFVQIIFCHAVLLS